LIFILRLIIFSFFIILGFRISLRSKNLRAVISVIYGTVLLYYTFLIRVRFSVDVSASDYGHAVNTTKSVAEQIWSILKAIFGMDASGHLAGVYWEAAILNVLLFVPLGYLVYLHFLCGDGDIASSEEGKAGEAVSTGVDKDVKDEEPCVESVRSVEKKGITTILICIAVSICIELLQGITGLGMTDINDVIANTVGGSVGVGMVWFYCQRLRRSRV